MKRPKEIWWCHHITENSDIGDMFAEECLHCEGKARKCEIDGLPCDAVKGTITWEPSSPKE